VPSTLYLDHNVVVEISHKRIKIDHQQLDKNGVRFVLSPSHWIQAARANTLNTALQTARVMDSLRPLWLRERRSLQRREVRAWLAGKPNAASVVEPFCNSVSEVATELSRLSGAFAIVTTPKLIQYLYEKGGFRDTMRNNYQANAGWFERNVKHVAKGKLTIEKEKQIWVGWVAGIANEERSPVSEQVIARASRSEFPAVLTEYEIAKENWRRAVVNPSMRLSPQRLADVFHLIVALPYVDSVLSQDSGFHSLASAVCPKLPFKTATLLNSLQELDAPARRR
jgi:hypothetical protein